MLSKSDLEDIIHAALSKGAEFAEIFIEESRNTTLTCEDNKIEKINSGTDRGAGIRVYANGIFSYVCSNDIEKDSLIKLVDEIPLLAANPSPSKFGGLKPSVSSMPYPIVRRPDEVSIEEKITTVEHANKTAREQSDKIKQVMVRYADSNQAITIANSEGTYIEDQRIRTRYFINVIAAKDNIIQTGYEAPGGSMGFELIALYPPISAAVKAAKRALLMLDAPHSPAGKMTVVLAAEAGGTLIHEACGHALEADFIAKGTSIFKDKIGQKVASEQITVIDDGTLTGNFGSFRFDDEGAPSSRTVLIDKGVLTNYMSDWHSSGMLKIKRTGNGRRESFRNKPVPRMTNTFIDNGKYSADEIIASVKNGLLISRMGGGEVNVTNGDFVFEVTEGYIIEDGQKKNPVRGAILIGNGPKILETIDMVGNDLTHKEFQTGVCGKYDHAPVSDGQPTLRIPEIVVGGRM